MHMRKNQDFEPNMGQSGTVKKMKEHSLVDNWPPKYYIITHIIHTRLKLQNKNARKR